MVNNFYVFTPCVKWGFTSNILPISEGNLTPQEGASNTNLGLPQL